MKKQRKEEHRLASVTIKNCRDPKESINLFTVRYKCKEILIDYGVRIQVNNPAIMRPMNHDNNQPFINQD